MLKFKKAITTGLAFCLITTMAIAQGGSYKPGCSYMGIPDLSDEQKSKIEDLRVPHLKAMNLYKAEINKLKAELKVLEIADSPDAKKIDSKIDELSSVKNKMDKESSKHRMAIREILTPEQKVIFDAHAGKRYGQKPGRFDGDKNEKNFNKGRQYGPRDGSGPNFPRTPGNQ
ncbi:MAG: Spy/CpxP family protein refolding chaperone [Bacteroidales bacterium]|nr:Spy/CpxP family protein refolding chaperone [Bacteroidales bacterium]